MTAAPPRPPFSALAGERDGVGGIGHNQGPPLDPAISWRRACWKAARAELHRPLPLEVVRRRVRRARELGLDYPCYASILLGSGRDVIGFLFTSEGMGLRLARTVEMPAPVTEKLRDLRRCERLLLAEPGQDPETLAAALRREADLTFAGAAEAPAPGAPWRAGREAVRAALAPLKAPSDAVVMIGARADERAWADAAGLAKFLPGAGYFGLEAPRG